jgi:hypothetical protein
MRSVTCLLTHPSSPHIWHLPYVSNLFPPHPPPHPLYIAIGSTKCYPNPNIDIHICITRCRNHCIATFKNTTFYTPHWRETFLYTIFLRRRSQSFRKTTSNRRVTSPRNSTNGFRTTNIYEPTFH